MVRVAEKVWLPAGYWIGWGGQFEQLVSATPHSALGYSPRTLIVIFPHLCWPCRVIDLSGSGT